MPAHQDVQRIVLETVAAHMSPGAPRRVIVEPYVNWVDEARFGLGLALQDHLEAAGETRFPRLSFRTERELAHIDDPDA